MHWLLCTTNDKGTGTALLVSRGMHTGHFEIVTGMNIMTGLAELPLLYIHLYYTPCYGSLRWYD
jgi:hypothetical protein